MSKDLVVVKLDQARMLLAEAKDAGQAKQVADIAAGLEVVARRRKLSREAIQNAHAVWVDAMTLTGEFLRAAPRNKGAKGSKVTGSKRVPVKDTTPTLADHGI